MAIVKKPNKSLKLPHVRSGDYREIWADGTLSRVSGEEVKITFFINDHLITAEHMELVTHNSIEAAYRPVSADEMAQRIDLVAIRMRISEFMNLHTAIVTRMEKMSRDANEASKSESES